MLQNTILMAAVFERSKFSEGLSDYVLVFFAAYVAYMVFDNIMFMIEKRKERRKEIT